jgi:hypothetical protein
VWRVFSLEQRQRTRTWIEELARADERIISGALIGSLAAGEEDDWSDIDLTFGLVDEIAPRNVLEDWTARIADELGVLDYWDLRSGPSVYRVFLLANGLEADISVTPQSDLMLRGARVQVLFGAPRNEPATLQPDGRELIGYGWHHIIHSRSAIERGQPWRAEYWISGARDKTLALACLRVGETAWEARGVDHLPASVTGPLTQTLVRSLDAAELRRALAAATANFLSEVALFDAQLAARLDVTLREFGGI